MATYPRRQTLARFLYLVLGGLLLLLLLEPSRDTLSRVVHAQTASTNQLSLTLRQLDLSGTPILNRTIGPLSWNGTTGNFLLLTSSPTPQTITIPKFPVLNVYIRNLAVPSSPGADLLTLVMSPYGGAQNSLTQLVGAGAVYVIWEVSQPCSGCGGIDAGISSLRISSTGASTPVEVFLGS